MVHETNVLVIMLMGRFTVVDFEYVSNSCIFAKLQSVRVFYEYINIYLIDILQV